MNFNLLYLHKHTGEANILPLELIPPPLSGTQGGGNLPVTPPFLRFCLGHMTSCRFRKVPEHVERLQELPTISLTQYTAIFLQICSKLL